MSERTTQTGLEEPGEDLPISQAGKWDWRVVVLELLIVFVGLFAALQLENYREERAFREAQHRHLVRMQEELAEYLIGIGQTQQFLEVNLRAVGHVLASVQTGEILNADSELFEFGVIYFAHLPSNPLPRASYEEMVASGMFSALESEELKSVVSNLYSLDDYAQTNFSWWRQGALEFENRIAAFVDYHDATDQPASKPYLEAGEWINGEPNRRIRFNFAEMAGSRIVRNGFYWAYDSVNDWLKFTQMLHESATEAQALIRQQLGS